MATSGGNVKLHDAVGTDIESDSMTKRLITIDGAHHEIHDGLHFCWNDSFAIASIGVSNVYHFATPTSTALYAHLTFNLFTDAPAQLWISEAPSLSGAGSASAQPIVNNNRLSANTSGCLIYGTPTITTATGTVIFNTRLGNSSGAGGSATRELGITRGENEFILNAGTSYLFGVNALANSINCTLALNWYMHSS